MKSGYQEKTVIKADWFIAGSVIDSTSYNNIDFTSLSPFNS